MNGSVLMVRFLIFAFTMVLTCASAHAERPITLDKFVYSAEQGYILVWVGPLDGRKSFLGFLDFMQISPETGKTFRDDNPELRTINARRIKDAAAVYNDPKPLVVQNDLGLFLIPVNPGRWVVGAVNGTALTLGSYAFDVTPASVTYAGKILVGPEDGSSNIPEIKLRGEMPESALIRRSAPQIWTIVLRRPSYSDIPTDVLPTSIKDHVTLANIEGGVRFNNYLSSVINRAADLGPIPHALPIPAGRH